MDESALQDRLDRIEQRQYLVLVLLVVPYLVGVAELVGYWVAGALYAASGLLLFALFVRSRRRGRSAAGQ